MVHGRPRTPRGSSFFARLVPWREGAARPLDPSETRASVRAHHARGGHERGTAVDVYRCRVNRPSLASLVPCVSHAGSHRTGDRTDSQVRWSAPCKVTGAMRAGLAALVRHHGWLLLSPLVGVRSLAVHVPGTRAPHGAPLGMRVLARVLVRRDRVPLADVERGAPMPDRLIRHAIGERR